MFKIEAVDLNDFCIACHVRTVCTLINSSEI
jgi:hypothetical protein